METRPDSPEGASPRQSTPPGPAAARGGTRHLEAAARGIATLSSQWTDDVAPGEPARAELVAQLRAVVAELETAHDQLRRQSAELEQSKALVDAERARFRELFEVTREGHVVTDLHGVVRETNRAAATMLNLPGGQLVGKPLAVFVPPEARRQFRIHTYQAHADNAELAWTTMLLPRDQAALTASISVAPIVNGRGQATALRWLIRDQAEARTGLVATREPAAIVRAALDALPAHVAVLDADGRIVTVNRAWRDAEMPAGLFGIDATPGADYLELCASAAAAGHAGAEAVRDAVRAVLHGRVARADAMYACGASSAADASAHTDRCWFALRATRCEGPDPVTAVVTHEDVTAERQSYARERALLSERAARMAAEEASRAKSEFLATLSHELRTPLNAIAGYAQLLEMGVRGPVTREQTEDLRRILRSERHLLGLINELLNFSRLERGEVPVDLAPVPLEPAVAEVLELVEPQANVKSLHVSTECPDHDLIAVADPEKLRQVLLNLLSNALKFTPPGGEIRVRCEARDAHAIVRVHDTGVGIPAARLNEVFDPFVQIDRGMGRSFEGVGLGLAISRTLARAMGGDLSAESEVGVGSSFELTLPRADARGAVE